jgi:enamine deaminase RidA (YjgF/YER057c/UK114 family)
MIERRVTSSRWADVVIHNHVATWVEVADDASANARGQIAQVFRQIEATLESVGSDRRQLMMVMIHLADMHDAAALNELWDAWVPEGSPPVRACVQSGLSGGLKVEMVITAAVPPGNSTGCVAE